MIAANSCVGRGQERESVVDKSRAAVLGVCGQVIAFRLLRSANTVMRMSHVRFWMTS